MIDANGYVRYYWPGHPLANAAGHVLEHYLVLWTISAYRDAILVRCKSPIWSIHHINGRRDDNHPANLEWRMRGKHPAGLGLTDAIAILAANGINLCTQCSPAKSQEA